MNGTATALCAAISIGETGDVAPDWLHLLPAGAAQTRDGRGPYRIGDAAALMAASLAGGKLALDENHSTDLAAPKGDPAPAHAWIVELQNRADGIWGRAEWIDPAAGLWKRYRGVSPVIAHRKDGTVTAILRASLTNTPNLTGLTSLHSTENTMDLRLALIEALGLAGEADDGAIIAAIKAMKDGEKVTLQSALGPIALVVGAAEDADAATVLAGVQQLAGGDDSRLTALQSELTTVTTALNTLTDDSLRKDAVAFVDGAINAGRVGVKPSREEFISMHMKDRARAEKILNGMPILAPGRTVISPATPDEGTNDNPALLARKATAYQRKMAADGVTLNIAQAVRAVQEGKAA
jgi:phage I-like protein